MNAIHLVKKGTARAVDVLGPTIEFLSSPTEGAAYCVMKGMIPPGGFVPLHSHADPESFFVLSGNVLVLTEGKNGSCWVNTGEGDFLEIPGGMKHAFRNTSDGPVVQLITTTPRLARFFQEIGRPVTGDPPTPDDLQRFAQVTARYGYWLGSPEENAAVGIPVLH